MDIHVMMVIDNPVSLDSLPRGVSVGASGHKRFGSSYSILVGDTAGTRELHRQILARRSEGGFR
ncbi:hypothetical protein PanWU01x14_013800 [Parasponia andersonii]|uniref:Uncharacterized protein n=1 Tax=Parasponia andersonii TaxID=3476 RepID=A0A2P5E147_PARAD|nr:hypothetical protein PanWU01x14_013800 [Parasponia andersonii]